MLAHPHKQAGAQVPQQAPVRAAGDQLNAYYASQAEPAVYQQQMGGEPQLEQQFQAGSQPATMQEGGGRASYAQQTQQGAYQMAPGPVGPPAYASGEPSSRPFMQQQQQRLPAYMQQQQQQHYHVPQQQQQIPVRHPQAGQQQLIEQQQQHRVAASGNYNSARHLQQQQPMSATGQLQHQSHHQHHHQHHNFNPSVNLQQPIQATSSNQVQQPPPPQQQISAGPHLMSGGVGGGVPPKDLIRVEQYQATQSPTLLQQQLNRHRPPPATMRGQQHVQVTAGGPRPMARAPPTHQQQQQQLEPSAMLHATGPQPGAFHAHNQHLMEPSPINGAHHHPHPHQNHLHQQQVYQQQQQRVPPPHSKQRAPPTSANSLRQQQQVIAPQHHQPDMGQPQQHQFSCNPTPPLTPNGVPLAAGAAGIVGPRGPPEAVEWQQAYPEAQVKHRIAPKNPAGPHQTTQQAHFQPQQQQPNSIQYQQPPSQAGHFIPAPAQAAANVHLIEQQQHVIASNKPLPVGPLEPAQVALQVRLTLPLRDAILIGPFKLEHGLQFTTKSFHLRPQLFNTLSKSAHQQQQQTGAVVQELQFRAYLSTSHQQQQQQQQHHSSACPTSRSSSGDSLLLANQSTRPSNACQWPDLFQISCNQQLVHLDRRPLTPTGFSGVVSASKTNNAPPPQGGANHKAADIFPYCQPGDNLLELQANDCYCSHEFVLELVDRPTLKAFMNSCFKSRLLSTDSCLLKLRSLFGAPNSLCQLPIAGIFNEYLTEYSAGNGINPGAGEQAPMSTRLRLSLRCPLTGKRMCTPARGPNCKHLQCFDLESFLYANRERTRWHCPLCQAHVPFNMLELDQLQMSICQTIQPPPPQSHPTDDILIDAHGQWQAYQPHTQLYHTTAKANGTYHPQTRLTSKSPAAAASSPLASHWESQPQQQHSPLVAANSPGGVRRPPSASLATPGGRRSVGPPQSKRPYAPAATQSDIQTTTASSELGLSPLAAMERTIIHHEQQMGPPPFDANLLTSSPSAASPLRSSSSSSNLTTTTSTLNASHQSPGGGGSAAALAAGSSFASPVHHHQSPAGAGPSSAQACSSPARQMAGSPCQTGAAPTAARLPQSPAQQQQQAAAPLTQVSTPATPLTHIAPETPATPGTSASNCSSSLPAAQTSQSQQITAAAAPMAQHAASAVDHQPLSNGSASALSIGSSSTLTPSNQSLGSVGMGGDSRCNTAPLQNNLGSLDDLVVLPGGLSLNHQASASPYNNKQQQQQPSSGNQQSIVEQQQHVGSDLYNRESNQATLVDEAAAAAAPFASVLAAEHDKSEMLMSKLMMDGDRERQSSDLALALEEAEWKQQLDQGKSEHLANFLNEPQLMMNNGINKKQHHHHYYNSNELVDGLNNNQMLSGGLNPSDDEGANLQSPLDAQSSNSSPLCSIALNADHHNHLNQNNHHLQSYQNNQQQQQQQLPDFQTNQHQAQQHLQHQTGQLDHYANYLEAHASNVGTVADDDDAGLPPDDSILDLFER